MKKGSILFDNSEFLDSLEIQTDREKKMQKIINRRLKVINKKLEDSLDERRKEERMSVLRTAEMARNYMLM